jgi:uncharacterized membrane protein YqjE
MSQPPIGLLLSLRGFAATATGLVRTRLALLKLELNEEADRLIGLLLWGFAAVLLGVAGLVFVAVFLTVLLWDGYRLAALGVFAALFVSAAALAITMAVKLVKRGSGLFATSLAELQRDESALRADATTPEPEREA